MDFEIVRRPRLPAELGADPAIARLQAAGVDLRPDAFGGCPELFGAIRVDRVIEAVDPLDIRPEARATAQIKRQVDAEAACDRYRIDQPRKGGRALIHEVGSPRIMRLRHEAGVQTLGSGR